MSRIPPVFVGFRLSKTKQGIRLWRRSGGYWFAPRTGGYEDDLGRAADARATEDVRKRRSADDGRNR